MFVVVPRSDRLRSAVEDAIRKRYWERYGALLSSFARIIVAELSQSGNVECAAGIRFGDEAFFSECYLDLPMELLLRDQFERTVRRDKIVEVSHLAAPCSGRSLVFVKNLIEMLRTRDAEWAIFTATKPLRGLLRRNRLAMTELGCADRSRVPHPECWGNYFKHDPRIMAVNHRTAFEPRQFYRAPIAPQPAADARIF
jgi:Thermostable hemolysin